MEVTE